MRYARRHKPVDPAFVCGHKDPAVVRELLTKAGGKWRIFLILSLAKLLGNRARFSELEKTIPGISQRMLTLTLRDGLVAREVFPEIPPRVEYELPSLGKLDSPNAGLVDWAVTNWEQVKKAQSRFDADRYSRERAGKGERIRQKSPYMSRKTESDES
jgi:DNA-binding HxlR family transcriptional regulator